MASRLEVSPAKESLQRTQGHSFQICEVLLHWRYQAHFNTSEGRPEAFGQKLKQALPLPYQKKKKKKEKKPLLTMRLISKVLNHPDNVIAHSWNGFHKMGLNSLSLKNLPEPIWCLSPKLRIFQNQIMYWIVSYLRSNFFQLYYAFCGRGSLHLSLSR